jgi:hypothetical protein
MTDNASYRRDAALLAAIIAAILAITFAPFIFGDRSLMSAAHDVPSIYVTGAKPPREAQVLTQIHALDAGAPGWQTEPWLAIQHRIVGDGRWPWWDPYDGYGQPFAAAMQPQPFYPLTSLLALAPSPRTYAAWVLVRLFLAGWFTALFLRLFTGRGPAAIAGTATMFTGYYLLYYNMPHLSVEVGLPMLLWATELVVRRPGAPARVAALAGTAGLAYLGGMPESALLVLTMAVLYGVVRVVAATQRVRAALALIGSHLLGIALGGAALVPFVAYVGASFNTHDPSHIGGAVVGMQSDGNWQNVLFTEFVPRAFGSPWANILSNGIGHSGVRGFFGCAALVLAIVAVITAVRRRDATAGPVLYFALAATYIILKRFGNPLVAWTGLLPLFRLIGFPKYGEVILGVSIAILAGFGLAALWSRRAGIGTVVVAFGVTLFALSGLTLHAIPQLPANAFAREFWVALIPALMALLITGTAAVVLASGQDARRIRVGALVAVLVAIVAEPFFGYLRPTIWRGAPPVTDNPYAGAPYLSWLDAHVVRDRERILATGGILFPNWSGAYGFADPRSINALYPANYIPFVDAFITRDPATSDDQFDRFVATRPIFLRAPLVDRWLELSSVGYLVQNDGNGIADSPPGGVLDALWHDAEGQVAEPDRSAVHPATVLIDGVTENALFEHPPHAVHYQVVVPRDRPVFVADLAIDPRAYTGASCGGPVTFALDALDGNGRRVGTLRSTVDAFDRAADRHWRAVALDLSAQRGALVDLHFSTSSVVGCNGWALWGEPRFTVASGRHTIRAPHVLFPLVFSTPDAVIYRVPNALPRLSLFHRARSVTSLAGALAVLTADRFDVHTDAVVEGPLPALGAPSTGDRVTQTASHSDDIVADVTAGSAAMLMQNDTWFPGWVARLDGTPVPLLRVDGIFRGVAVPAGHHTVEIAYEAASSTIGLLSSGVALLVIVMFFALGATRVRRPATATEPET